MTVFIENSNLLIQEFNEMAGIAQRKAYISIGMEIQKDAIETIINYRKELNEPKAEFVKRNEEYGAKLVYCIDSSLLAVQYELQMLVNIKEDNMGEAWGNLVNAQVIYGTVLRNWPPEFQVPSGYVERLESYEKLLFPNLYFQSVGGLIKKAYCSICRECFNNCDHIKGRLYMGELCRREITEMDLDEVSFVENPANKHCRVIAMEIGGKMIDILTLREHNTPVDKTNN